MNMLHITPPASRDEIEGEIVALELEAKTTRWNIKEFEKVIDENRSRLAEIEGDLAKLRERLKGMPQ